VRKKLIISVVVILLLIIFLFFAFSKEKASFRIYTYNPKTETLTPEEVIIEVPRWEKVFSRDKILEKVLEKLIEVSSRNGENFPIPKGTKLLGISVKNNIAYVNFSQELKRNHPGGSMGEMLTVYSIVDTLTEFPEVHKVQILIDSAVVETLVGHMDLTVPLERDLSLVQ